MAVSFAVKTVCGGAQLSLSRMNIETRVLCSVHTFLQIRNEGTMFQSHKHFDLISILNKKVNLFGMVKFNLCLTGMLWYFKWQLIIKNVSILLSPNKHETDEYFTAEMLKPQ